LVTFEKFKTAISYSTVTASVSRQRGGSRSRLGLPLDPPTHTAMRKSFEKLLPLIPKLLCQIRWVLNEVLTPISKIVRRHLPRWGVCEQVLVIL